MVLDKRSIAPLIVFAFAQTACNEDPDAWAVPADAGADGAVTVESDASVDETSTGSTEDTADLTLDIDTTDGVVTLDAATDQTSADEDASATSASTTGPVATSEGTSGGSSSVVDTSGDPVSSETSVAPTSATPTSETPTSETPTSETPTSETPTSAETSAPTGGETSAVDTTSSDSSDTSAPSASVCGQELNEAEAISLAAALANYPVPGSETGDAGVAGDAGVTSGAVDAGGAVAPTECYPACIAALMYACPAGSNAECALDYQDYSTSACWYSGVSQVLSYTYQENGYTAIQAAYSGGAPCISGTRAVDYETGDSIYAWYDGTGALVATGTGQGEQVDVTCVGDAQVYSVDRSQPQCDGMSDALYSQFDCGIYYY